MTLQEAMKQQAAEVQKQPAQNTGRKLGQR